jgi:hypothetical protein
MSIEIPKMAIDIILLSFPPCALVICFTYCSIKEEVSERIKALMVIFAVTTGLELAVFLILLTTWVLELGMVKIV